MACLFAWFKNLRSFHYLLRLIIGVEKPLQCSQWEVFGGLMTPHNREIADCGSFCEVIFFCIFPKNLLGDFFDSHAMFIENPDAEKALISEPFMQ